MELPGGMIWDDLLLMVVDLMANDLIFGAMMVMLVLGLAPRIIKGIGQTFRGL